MIDISFVPPAGALGPTLDKLVYIELTTDTNNIMTGFNNTLDTTVSISGIETIPTANAYDPDNTNMIIGGFDINGYVQTNYTTGAQIGSILDISSLSGGFADVAGCDIYDGKLYFMKNGTSNSIHRVDWPSGTTIETMSPAVLVNRGNASVAVDKNTGAIYVSSTGAGTDYLYRFAAWGDASASHSTTIAYTSVLGMAYDADADELYVNDSNASTTRVYNSTFGVVTSFSNSSVGIIRDMTIGPAP